MKKKLYLKPEIEEVELLKGTDILCGSQEIIDDDDPFGFFRHFGSDSGFMGNTDAPVDDGDSFSDQ